MWTYCELPLCRFARHAGAALCALVPFTASHRIEAGGIDRPHRCAQGAAWSPRELAGVLSCTRSHIANEDLRVMGLADSDSRLTSLRPLGQIAILLILPAQLVWRGGGHWPGLLLLAASPPAGPARTARLVSACVSSTLPPCGGTGLATRRLASALAKIERVSRSWRAGCGRDGAIPVPLLAHASSNADSILALLTLAPGFSISRCYSTRPISSGTP